MKSVSKNLLKELLQGTDMPDLYWADIPMVNKGTGEEELVPMPFLLVHEVFQKIVSAWGGNLSELTSLTTSMLPMKRSLCQKLGVDPATFIPLGLHGDG
eukprot:361016-Lingulodinium_polyedra.AAC.1